LEVEKAKEKIAELRRTVAAMGIKHKFGEGRGDVAKRLRVEGKRPQKKTLWNGSPALRCRQLCVQRDGTEGRDELLLLPSHQNICPHQK